jgi:hypothetical protein
MNLDGWKEERRRAPHVQGLQRRLYHLRPHFKRRCNRSEKPGQIVETDWLYVGRSNQRTPCWHREEQNLRRSKVNSMIRSSSALETFKLSPAAAHRHRHLDLVVVLRALKTKRCSPWSREVSVHGATLPWTRCQHVRRRLMRSSQTRW